MTYQDILKDLKEKNYKPIYFLSGDEPYYIDLITDYISENVLNETEKTFNQITLYGKDTEITDLINTCKKFPMMATHQVVIVKEAQELKNFDVFENYAKSPLNSTIVVLAFKHKKLAKNTRVYKAIAKTGLVFESKKLYENQVQDWILRYVKSKDCTIAPEAAALLTEFLGVELSKVSNEIEKLVITLPENHRHITPALIEKNIGISKDFNTFELTKALGTKNVFKANQIIDHFAKNPKDNPLVLVLSSIYNYYRKIFTYHFIKDKNPQNIASALKIKPFFVNEYRSAAAKYNPAKIFAIFGYLRECDVKSKGIGNATTSDGDLLKELVFKILH